MINYPKRVVVTGMGLVSSLGHSPADFLLKLREYQNTVSLVDEFASTIGLNTHLGCPVKTFDLPETFTRKKLRTMGKVSQFACLATQYAIKDANFAQDYLLHNQNVGVAYGSCSGSSDALADFASVIKDKNTSTLNANTYLKMMAHTTAVNIGLFFNLSGRIIPTSSACTSSSQAIGYAYESIKHGLQKVMIAGGADELCTSQVAVFDTLFAASTKNKTPNLTPSPFDVDRDGLVLGEGAGTLILEEYEHAQKRGANIYAELVGFSTNSDGSHPTQPEYESMQDCMQNALFNADINHTEIDYISAHATGTIKGDIAESIATKNVFGSQVPVSSLKSYIGHTLGACGAIESINGIEMMSNNWIHPTLNLNEIDPNCAELNYVFQKGKNHDINMFINNNFAFGGINTSLIFKKV